LSFVASQEEELKISFFLVVEFSQEMPTGEVYHN
jgi:hypothetical protein